MASITVKFRTQTPTISQSMNGGPLWNAGVKEGRKFNAVGSDLINASDDLIAPKGQPLRQWFSFETFRVVEARFLKLSITQDHPSNMSKKSRSTTGYDISRDQHTCVGKKVANDLKRPDSHYTSVEYIGNFFVRLGKLAFKLATQFGVIGIGKELDFIRGFHPLKKEAVMGNLKKKHILKNAGQLKYSTVKGEEEFVIGKLQLLGEPGASLEVLSGEVKSPISNERPAFGVGKTKRLFRWVITQIKVFVTSPPKLIVDKITFVEAVSKREGDGRVMFHSENIAPGVPGFCNQFTKIERIIV